MPADFPGAFIALRALLARHSRSLVVSADVPGRYMVMTRATGPNGKPLWFGAVLTGKRAVTLHFMPLYYNPRLLAEVHPDLRPRMQGKACFNFQRPDAVLLKHLRELTQRGFDAWKRAGFLAVGTLTAERMASALRASGVDTAVVAARSKRVVAKANARRKATLARKAVASPRKRAREGTAATSGATRPARPARARRAATRASR
jgi:hypothetical protein